MPNLSVPGMLAENDLWMVRRPVDKSAKTQKNRGTQRLKVSKRAFDKVLGKLIQTKPQKRKNASK